MPKSPAGPRQLRLSDMWKSFPQSRPPHAATPADAMRRPPAAPPAGSGAGPARPPAPPVARGAPGPVVQRREQGIDTDPQQGVASPTSGSEDGGGDGLTFEDVSGVSLGPGDRIPLPIPGQGQDGGAERRRTRLEEQYAGIRQLAGSPDLETLMRVVTLGAQAESDADQLVGFLMEEDAKYMDLVVPFVARLALELADLFPLGLARLPRGVNRSVTLTQRQIASLLAHGFFCTFDHRRRPAFYPFINFDMLYSGHPDRPSSTKYRAKLKFIFHYFDCVRIQDPQGSVTFHRQCIPDHLVPDWAQLGTLPLCDVTFSQKNIEDLRDTTQVDFANKFIGGGVLGSGFVQEEILFMVMPELIAACAIAERLDPNEALFMIGAQRYSDYSGYSGSTRWAGPHNDLLPVDERGRRRREMVGIDAEHFSRRNSSKEFSPECVARELCKAYAGFCHSGESFLPTNAPIATGNWGCGAFCGSLELKSLIQIMAASMAGRNLVYCPFDQTQFADDMMSMLAQLRASGVTVGKLFKLIGAFHRESFGDNRATTSRSLFFFLRKRLGYDARAAAATEA